MTLIIRAGSDLIARYQSYLSGRRYAAGTIDRLLGAARDLIDAYPAGIPLDEQALVERAELEGGTASSQKSRRASARRFYEFLDHEIGRKSQRSESA